MRIAHVVRVVPGKCGLYESTREIVCALRAAGHDSRMVPARDSAIQALTTVTFPEAALGAVASGKEFNPETDELYEDRGAPTAHEDWLKECDVLLSHSGLGECQRAQCPDTPLVQLLHGAPEYCFRMENGSSILTKAYWQGLEAVVAAGRQLVQPNMLPWWALSGGIPQQEQEAIGKAGENFELALEALDECPVTDAPGVKPGMRAYSSMHAINLGPNADQWAAFVTFWPQHVPYWELIVPPEKLHCVQSCVDLDYWDPAKVEPDYDWGGTPGEINVVCSSRWRAGNVDAFEIVTAFWHFAMARPLGSVKLHIYGGEVNLPSAWETLIKTMRQLEMIGEMPGHVSLDRMRSIYRVADLVITPHHVATRGVREPMAMGCPVVANTGYGLTGDCERGQRRALCYTWDIRDTHTFQAVMGAALGTPRSSARGSALHSFNPAVPAQELVEVIETVI